MKLFPRIITLCVLAVFAAAVYAGGDGVRVKHIKGYGSGWSHDSVAADLNGDGFGGGIGWSQGMSNFGRFTLSGSADILPWDGSFCDSGILLTYASNDGITRTQDGELIYSRMSEDSPSTVCFNPSDNTSTFELYGVIVGGTGKYVGATGNIVTTGTSLNLNPAHVALEYEFEGEVFILTGND